MPNASRDTKRKRATGRMTEMEIHWHVHHQSVDISTHPQHTDHMQKFNIYDLHLTQCYF